MGENCFVAQMKDFQICGLPNLENINIKKESFYNIKMLAICNNQLLKSINIEDGTRYYNHGEIEGHTILVFVKEVKIESKPEYCMMIIDNPSLEELVTSKYSFIFTTSLILSSNC